MKIENGKVFCNCGGEMEQVGSYQVFVDENGHELENEDDGWYEDFHVDEWQCKACKKVEIDTDRD